MYIAFSIWRRDGIERDGGLKPSYEQRNKETHLGVGGTDLATMNAFARVTGGDAGSNRFQSLVGSIRFGFLTDD